MSHERIAYNLELEPEFHDEMKPIRTCSDDTPIGLQMATGELREYQAQPKREDRQNLAKRIAFKIATSLVAGMEHEDTHNGYKKNKWEYLLLISYQLSTNENTLPIWKIHFNSSDAFRSIG